MSGQISEDDHCNSNGSIQNDWKELTEESQLSDTLSDLDSEKIEKISEDDNLCKTVESANDNDLKTTLDTLDCSDDHDNDLQVKNESCGDTDDLLHRKSGKGEEIELTEDEKSESIFPMMDDICSPL